MSETECPQCGAMVDLTQLNLSDEASCPACGTLLSPDQDAYDVVQRIRDDVYAEKVPPQSTLCQLLRIALVCTGGLLGICGALALHAWTVYLFYTHWGAFYAIMAFLTPPLGELVALVACFWWNAWFYVLAVLGLFSALICGGLSGDVEEKPTTGLAFLGITLILGGAFTYFAIDSARRPRVLTQAMRREVEDISRVICIAISLSSSTEPVVLAKLTEAKAILRKRLGKYDRSTKAEIRQVVDAYLRAICFLQEDMILCAQRNSQRDSDGPFDDFKISERTRRAFAVLPSALRTCMKTSTVVTSTA